MTVFGQFTEYNCCVQVESDLNAAPGTGPFLSYKQVNHQVILTCRVDSVFPEPEVDLMWTQGIGMSNNKEDNVRLTV